MHVIKIRLCEKVNTRVILKLTCITRETHRSKKVEENKKKTLEHENRHIFTFKFS